MDTLSILAASGMKARMESLEMLANNIANSSTAGFKADREFYSLYMAPEALEGAGSTARLMPPHLPVIERHWTDFSKGLLRETGNPLHLGFRGEGFFVVGGPSGPLYTRNGSFRLSEQGVLQTMEGYPVLNTEGKPITLNPDLRIEVTPSGEIFQDGQRVARLLMVDVRQPVAVHKRDGVYFSLSSPSPPPPAAPDPQLDQGHLESANIAPAEAALRVIGVMRQFEALQKAIQIGGEMNRRAVEEVARIGS